MPLRRSFKKFATRFNSFSQKVVHKSRNNKAGSSSKPHTESAAIIYNLPEIDAGPELPDLSFCEIEEETIDFLHPSQVLDSCSGPDSSPEAETHSDASSSRDTSKTFSSIRTSAPIPSSSRSDAESADVTTSDKAEQNFINTPDLDNLTAFINVLPFPTTYAAYNRLTEDFRETGGNHSLQDKSGKDDFAEIRGAIDTIALQSLALTIRRYWHKQSHRFSRLPKDLTCTTSSQTVHGSYNLLMRLEFSDGVTWMARFPCNGLAMTELDQKEMHNEFRIMRFVERHYSVPVPEVYYWTTKQTQVGPAFALIECLEGFALDSIWDKLDEACQLKALDEIAKAMVRLTTASFPQIGTIREDEELDFAGIGPMVQYTMNAEYLGTNQHEVGPFYSLERQWINTMNLDDSWSECDKRIAMLAINSIPDFMLGPGTITLAHPDLNSQNIMFDRNGQITGFIDWERASTALLSTGCARYPIWLMDDFDPYRYDFDASRVDEIDEALVDFRKYYAEAFARHAQAEGLKGYDPRITQVSHLLFAIEIMVYRRKERPLVRDELLDYAFGGEWSFTMEDYMKTLKNGMNEKYDGVIIDAFSKMWKPEWEMPWWEAAGIEARGDAEKGYTFDREDAEVAEMTFSKASSRSARIKSRVRGSWRSFKQSLKLKKSSRKRSSKPKTGAVLGLREMRRQQSAWVCGHAPTAKDWAYV